MHKLPIEGPKGINFVDTRWLSAYATTGRRWISGALLLEFLVYLYILVYLRIFSKIKVIVTGTNKLG